MVVALGRAVRYAAIAAIASHYRRHFIVGLRHLVQHPGWFLAIAAAVVIAITAAMVLRKRLQSARRGQVARNRIGVRYQVSGVRVLLTPGTWNLTPPCSVTSMVKFKQNTSPQRSQRTQRKVLRLVRARVTVNQSVGPRFFFTSLLRGLCGQIQTERSPQRSQRTQRKVLRLVRARVTVNQSVGPRFFFTSLLRDLCVPRGQIQTERSLTEIAKRHREKYFGL